MDDSIIVRNFAVQKIIKSEEMAKQMTRKDRQELYARASKYFEDISKLIFAGAVLSSIMKEDIGMWWVIGCGTGASLAMLMLAYRAYLKSRIS